MPQYCDEANLARAVGGPARLKELLDKDQDGIADADLVNVALDDAGVDITTALAVNLQLDAGPLKPPYTEALISHAARCAAFHAWTIGGEGQAMPPWIAQRREAAIRWAEKAGIRQLTLGTAAPAPAGRGPRIVDPDPDGTGISRAGFSRGFR